MNSGGNYPDTGGVCFNSIPQAQILVADVPYITIVGLQSAEATLMRGFTIHLTSESVLGEAQIYAAVHSLFDDPYAAGPAIGMLIAREHWASMEQVLALHAKWGVERPSIDRATRAFLEACGSPVKDRVNRSTPVRASWST